MKRVRTCDSLRRHGASCACPQEYHALHDGDSHRLEIAWTHPGELRVALQAPTRMPWFHSPPTRAVLLVGRIVTRGLPWISASSYDDLLIESVRADRSGNRTWAIATPHDACLCDRHQLRKVTTKRNAQPAAKTAIATFAPTIAAAPTIVVVPGRHALRPSASPRAAPPSPHGLQAPSRKNEA